MAVNNYRRVIVYLQVLSGSCEVVNLIKVNDSWKTVRFVLGMSLFHLLSHAEQFILDLIRVNLLLTVFHLSTF